MTWRRRARTVSVVAAVGGITLSAFTYLRYRRDIRDARGRVAARSRVADTPCGPIEYAIAGGDGPTVLAVHGAGGGYDQGLDLADGLIERGFRVIAPSRFGYLRTPLPADASAAAQADAHADLLDALGIPHAVVIGASAGGPSSMQFALRHPQRTDALILLVPLAYPQHIERRASPAMRWMLETSLQSDFVFWLFTRLAKDVVTRAALGTPPRLLREASDADRARVGRIIDHILPVSQRRAGLLNDSAIASTLGRYELERIQAPTLVVSTKDDGYATYDSARYSAKHIPGARFLGYPGGGHLLLGHQEEILEAIERLLAR